MTVFQPQELARIALETGAIKLNPEHPFTWASGFKMPVYNDNRLLLGKAEYRFLVAKGFQSILARLNATVDVVAGTATAGIPPATTLANLLETPLIYVRSAPKQHGMQNQVEGILQENQRVVVVEDLISTGESAARTVETVRQAGGKVDHCLCIFNYGFARAADLFRDAQCGLHSLLTFETLLDFAEETGSLTPKQVGLLRSWFSDPFGWAGKK